MPPDSAAVSKSAKAVDQLVIRKMNEKRRQNAGGSRSGSQQRQHHLPAPVASRKTRREVEHQAERLVRPISKYLQDDQDEEEDSDEMEEYFSEDEVGSLTNEPNGLIELASRKKRK